MVSVCLPPDALLQHLPSYLGFFYLGCGVSLHGCSSKAQPLLLTLDEGYLLTAAVPDLQRGIAPLGPLCLCSHRSSGCSSQPPALASDMDGFSQLPPLASGARWLLPATPDFGRGVSPPDCTDLGHGVAPPSRRPDLGCRVAPLGRSCAVAAWHSRPLPLTLDMG